MVANCFVAPASTADMLKRGIVWYPSVPVLKRSPPCGFGTRKPNSPRAQMTSWSPGNTGPWNWNWKLSPVPTGLAPPGTELASGWNVSDSNDNGALDPLPSVIVPVPLSFTAPTWYCCAYWKVEKAGTGVGVG